MKKTLVLGATTNPERYAYLATMRLLQHGHEVVPVGVKTGNIGGVEILHGQPDVPALDTVTLYLGAEHQRGYYDYILSLHPKRIIFNPGAENDELAQQAEKHGIEVVEGCTLVMLSIGTY
jgi:predicted CoA-binding protein